MEFWKGANGKQPGDPAKLAKILIEIASLPEPPLRFVAGVDAERNVSTYIRSRHFSPGVQTGNLS